MPETPPIRIQSDTIQSQMMSFGLNITMPADALVLFKTQPSEETKLICLVMSYGYAHVTRTLSAEEARAVGQELIDFANEAENQANAEAKAMLDSLQKKA